LPGFGASHYKGARGYLLSHFVSPSYAPIERAEKLFGEWVHRRRIVLDLTQAELADRVSCSLSMLRKIERDERRPSTQLAELLADHLTIDESQRESFLQLARGKLPTEFDGPNLVEGNLLPPLSAHISKQIQEQTTFVARERELQLLSEHLDQALQGRGRIVFIAGEAGRGKTSLLVEFARRSIEARSDLIVAGGSCDVFSGQGDPLLPFRDIFRWLTGDLEYAGMRGIFNQELAARLSAAIPMITEVLLDYGPNLIDKLIPVNALEAKLGRSYPHNARNTEILLRLKGLRARQRLAPAREQRQDSLFDEISVMLNTLAQRQPLVLILDDLHWIDPSSAALLGWLPRRIKESPILIVGSYRPENLAPTRSEGRPAGLSQHLLQEVLSETLLEFGQNRIDLDHYDPGEELAFVNSLLDLSENTFSLAFREHLANLTEGHPLFLVELLRDMKERGDIFQGEDGLWQERISSGWKNLPARVEGVIEKRLTRLTADSRELLAVASVQGETFFGEVIAIVRQTEPHRIMRQLSAELDRGHRLVIEQGIRRAGGERLSQYQFRHHLFQKYLYERLAPAERMYLHEVVGNALEALFERSAHPDDLPAAQLGRHFQEAHLHEKASRYLLRAGQQAVRVLAFDEAAAYFERGLSELEGLDPAQKTLRLAYKLELALARARWHSGRVGEAIAAYQQAIEWARALGDPQAFARAVLANEEPRWRLNLDFHTQLYIREALDILDNDHSGLKARLLVSLSRSLLAAGEQNELRTTVEQALEIARQIEDPVALCDALRVQAQIDRRPETTDTRLAAIQEMIATAESIPDQERLLDAMDLYVYDLLELGQIELADEIIAAQKKVASEIKQPLQIHIATVFQTMRAILRGEFETAERLAKEASDLSRQLGLAEMDGIFGIHMFTIRREQGRIHEIAPLVKLAVANSPRASAWRPGLALLYRTLDERQACRAIFEELADESFTFVPQDSLWVATLAYLSDVCAYLGDRERAARLYALLLPYDGRTVVVGGATACYGAVARFLGMLATTFEDWQAAEGHFQEAIALDERIKAWPWLAHSRFEYACMLLRRGRRADQQRALVLLQEAESAAQSLGMVNLAKMVAELSVQSQG
jgi:transcriptional regulator with XRE-family HTH domain/tetratricopeptide (TPR) repeat protein